MAYLKVISGTLEGGAGSDDGDQTRIEAFLEKHEAMHDVITDETQHYKLRNDLIATLIVAAENRGGELFSFPCSLDKPLAQITMFSNMRTFGGYYGKCFHHLGIDVIFSVSCHSLQCTHVWCASSTLVSSPFLPTSWRVQWDLAGPPKPYALTIYLLLRFSTFPSLGKITQLCVDRFSSYRLPTCVGRIFRAVLPSPAKCKR